MKTFPSGGENSVKLVTAANLIFKLDVLNVCVHSRVKIHELREKLIDFEVMHWPFLGTGIYRTASLLNHSCVPNCIALFNGPQIVIRSLRDIQPNDELLITYVNLTDPSVTRKEELKEGYMFECKCTLCDEPEYSDMLMRSMRCELCKPVPCVQPIEDVMVEEEWTVRFKKHYPGAICFDIIRGLFRILSNISDEAFCE